MLDSVIANTALLVPARSLAAAEAKLVTASAALAAAQTEHADILGHIRNLEERRAVIIERRQRGDRRGDDGGSLALIAADIEGLSNMRAEVEAGIESARQPVLAAERAVEAARYVLHRAEDELAEAALVAHAEQLDTAMRQAIGELEVLRRKLNRGTPAWAPSQPLRDELNRLNIQRAWR